ncbi:MAG: hypothetical protein JW734_02355 [Candidatus Omnitrophica bacterium]|nr:hypothetical protein [Candidatus Omnitrophota bacterium]
MLKFKAKMLIKSKVNIGLAVFVFFLVFSPCLPAGKVWSLVCFGQDSSDYVKRGWDELGKKNFSAVYQITDECMLKFEAEADSIASGLSSLPSKESADACKAMNDVATCYFIKGEALMREVKISEAKELFKTLIDKYPYALAWDPRGWFWSIKEKAEATLSKLTTGEIKEKEEEEMVITDIVLSDGKGQFPVDYEKYGEFKGAGTKDYKYEIRDQEGLSMACGEGVYPNTTSFRYDPEFIKLKKKLFKVDHWQVLNSRDLSLAFYKWNICGEPWGVKQFYLGDLLERSGLITQAIKAYYAVVVHFPKTYAWTYWSTPWYVAPAALSRIEYLLRRHTELGLRLEGASIKIENGFDSDIRNDVFIVDPGKFVRKSIFDSLRGLKRKYFLGPVVEEKGDKVKLVKYKNSDWRLLVEGKPFIIKAITYFPTRVGESPDEQTMANWTLQDTNDNNIIDAPFEAWVDKNRDNEKDPDEKTVGDFKLLKEMGVNCIRVYYQPNTPDKKILRKLYQDYGIMTIMGNFLGKYAFGSGASWEKGTDYSNPEHQANMLKNIEEMLKEFKDEPYILMWLLGNENVYGVACNADKDPASFFKFVDKAAQFVKEKDSGRRPVGICSGDTLYLDLFAEHSGNVDIFGANIYRGKYGFGSFWQDVRDYTGKPCLVTEYGAASIAKGYTLEEAEGFQEEYHRGCWQDIENNLAGSGAGSALGGVVFEWLDEWWKAYEPGYHDKEGLFTGPFLDGHMHEEWLGLVGQGDGRNSPFLRQLKKAYFAYKALWNR